MRLGWLSRLGIVLTAFGLPLTASYLVSQQLASDHQVSDATRKACLYLAESDQSAEARSAARQKCEDQWDRQYEAPVGPLWLETLGFVAVMFGIVWIIALAIYWSVIWILAGRGRQAQS